MVGYTLPYTGRCISTRCKLCHTLGDAFLQGVLQEACWVVGVPKNHPCLIGIFRHEPSILGIPHRKPPRWIVQLMLLKTRAHSLAIHLEWKAASHSVDVRGIRVQFGNRSGLHWVPCQFWNDLSKKLVASFPGEQHPLHTLPWVPVRCP